MTTVKGLQKESEFEALIEEISRQPLSGEEVSILQSIDNAISFYRQRANRLTDARAALDSQLEVVTTRLERLEESRRLVAHQGAAPSYFAGKRSESAIVRALAMEILRERGHPLSRAELLTEIERRGLKFRFSRPEKAVGKIMWAAKEFYYVNHGYWIVGEPLNDLKRSLRFRSRKHK